MRDRASTQSMQQTGFECFHSASSRMLACTQKVIFEIRCGMFLKSVHKPITLPFIACTHVKDTPNYITATQQITTTTTTNSSEPITISITRNRHQTKPVMYVRACVFVLEVKGTHNATYSAM